MSGVRKIDSRAIVAAASTKDVRVVQKALQPYLASTFAKSRCHYEDFGYCVLRMVQEKGKGFQQDIARRAIEDGIELSVKQRWCVAYAFVKIRRSVELVEKATGGSV